MKKLFLFALALCMIGCASDPKATAFDGPGAVNPEQTAVNKQVFQEVYAQVKDDADLSMNELVSKIALQFLGTEYVGGTLEREPERLLVFLDKTDCILFVEQCTAFALTVKGKSIQQFGDGQSFILRAKPSVIDAKPSYELLLHNIQQMRYRLGVIDGYASRVHYTSEWFLQNQTNGLMHEITADLGGVNHPQTFNYMSRHHEAYRQLQNDSVACVRIAQMEAMLEANGPYYYLTHDQLTDPAIMSKIQDGDIITFMDTHEGLDLAHVALAYNLYGSMHFIHASFNGRCVMVEPRTLEQYALNGIRVVRFNEF